MLTKPGISASASAPQNAPRSPTRRQPKKYTNKMVPCTATAGTRRAATLSTIDEASFRQRLGQFLLRRGFGWENVTPAVDRLWREHVDERIVPPGIA